MMLSIPPELERRLVCEAQRFGMSPNGLAILLLNQQLSDDHSWPELLGLLKSWIDEEGGEDECESDSALLRALDEDRLSERKLNPPELKGKTW